MHSMRVIGHLGRKHAGWYHGKTSSCNIETLIMERSTRPLLLTYHRPAAMLLSGAEVRRSRVIGHLDLSPEVKG